MRVIHKKFTELWAGVAPPFNRETCEHRLLLSQMIMKAAGLSNSARDFPGAEKLSMQLMAEMRGQGMAEMAMGLPISPMWNPNDETPLCVGQIGSYQFVAGPLMKQLNAFFPELDASMRQFDRNLERWKAMKAEWEAGRE
jgi:hypothetical protein